MLGVFAQFERGIIRERVNAGLARAKAQGHEAYIRRRRVKPSVEERIHELRKGGMGILKIAREVGVGNSVVQRVIATP